jgi:hypothetical protein
LYNKNDKVYILLKSKKNINNNHHQYLNKLKPLLLKLGMQSMCTLLEVLNLISSARVAQWVR